MRFPEKNTEKPILISVDLNEALSAIEANITFDHIMSSLAARENFAAALALYIANSGVDVDKFCSCVRAISNASLNKKEQRKLAESLVGDDA